MNKIGDLEKKLGDTESSFSPRDYKPTKGLATGGNVATSTQSLPSESDIVVATSCCDLATSSLFLPCHYFTYAAGTSTGG